MILQNAKTRLYDRNFFSSNEQIVYAAARLILLEIYSVHQFKSVIDIGCGPGAWLRAAKEVASCERMLGIDGEYARDIVKCSGADFAFQNLENRLQVENKFDLAISLEVAEHLSCERACGFIKDVSKCSDVALFSAAFPKQGGANHINEQWQSFWIKIWNDLGYDSFDILRQKFWTDSTFDECSYYIGGAFLFVKKDHGLIKKITQYKISANSYFTDIVHPKIYAHNCNQSLLKILYHRMFPSLQVVIRYVYFKLKLMAAILTKNVSKRGVE